VTRVLPDSELEHFPALEWSEVAESSSPELLTALTRVLDSQDGGTLSREQCLLLANAQGDDLLALLVAADVLRRDLVGNLVTYVVNRNMQILRVQPRPPRSRQLLSQSRDHGAEGGPGLGAGRN
jgi:hypothetical protein